MHGKGVITAHGKVGYYLSIYECRNMINLIKVEIQETKFMIDFSHTEDNLPLILHTFIALAA